MRHQAIRDFQASEPRPKVFVLTMKTGSCGITLTAATRVYLMEPCLGEWGSLGMLSARTVTPPIASGF